MVVREYMALTNAEKCKGYYQRHKENCKKQFKEYHYKHRDEILARQHKRLELHRDENKENCKKYHQTHKDESNKKQRERYQKNKDRYLDQMRDYREKNREKVLDGMKRYRQTENGRIADIKKYNKRKRELGFNILFENIFDEEVRWHHVDNINVVAIPKEIHELYSGNDTQRHRDNLLPIVEQLYPEIYSKIKRDG